MTSTNPPARGRGIVFQLAAVALVGVSALAATGLAWWLQPARKDSGQAQEKFAFSVRDDSVAHEITRLMGDRVAISYDQHPGIPLRCFGDTDYFVTAVRRATP